MASTDFKVVVIKNGIFPSNSYILTDVRHRKSILIDPGLDLPALQEAFEREQPDLIAVVSTHGHFDHIGQAAYFLDRYQVPFYLHQADLKLSKSANFYLKIARIDLSVKIPAPDHIFEGRSTAVDIGPFSLVAHNLPGHTAGSCIIECDGLLFSGDTLYRNGLGFNHFPGEDKALLRRSIHEIFGQFADDSMLYPGHGAAFRLAEVKTGNAELLDFISNKEHNE